MGLEFVYQMQYESTVDTLTMRNNVKRVLQNSAFKRSLARDSYHPSIVTEQKIPQNTLSVPKEDELQLNETLTFLQSDAALKLLNLTQRTDIVDTNIIDFSIDESKQNIFSA